MPPKQQQQKKDDGKSNGKAQTSQGHDVVEPPNTGWKEPVPSKEGGSEEGYLTKVSKRQ